MTTQSRTPNVAKVIREYLIRAKEYDERYLGDTDIAPEEWGWRTFRAVQVAAKRSGIDHVREIRAYLEPAIKRGTIVERPNKRPTQQGPEYRIR